MYSIGIHIQKGGVGKTTIAGNLAYEFAKRGELTCLIDLDHSQGNATTWMLNPKTEPKYEILDIAKKNISVKECLLKVRNNLYILPTFGKSMEFTKWIRSELSEPENLSFIEELLDSLRELRFEKVIFDLSPAMTYLEQQVYLSIDEVISPINADAFALDGIEILNEKLKTIQKRRQKIKMPELKRNKIIVNRINKSFGLDKDLLKELASLKKEEINYFFIRQNQKIKDTQLKNLFIGEDLKEEEVINDFIKLTDAFKKEMVG